MVTVLAIKLEPQSHWHGRALVAAFIILLIVIPQTSCRDGTNNATVKLTVSGSEFPPRLTAIISNSSARVVNVWKQNNSWGWENRTVDLQGVSGGEVFGVRRKNCDWTKNAPDFYPIEPNGEKEMVIDLPDGWWEIPRMVDLAREDYHVRIRLKIENSLEAQKFHVWTGQTVSEWRIESKRRSESCPQY